MNYDSFTTSGLYFHHHLVYQGLADFVSLDGPFYLDLIKVFYSNLRISGNGYLLSEVNKRRIKLKPDDWFNICHLKYEGRTVSFTDIPEDLPFDRDMALSFMLIPEMQGQRVRSVSDRLLHYVIVHILTPRLTNFAKLLHKDIFMLWLLKNNISINWPHHIMQHMLKCKDSDTPLSYGILITQIMQYCGVNVSADTRTTIGKRHHFSTSSLKRLNIVNVDGVWQHDCAVNDDEVQGQPQNPLHDEHGIQPDHSIGNHEEPPFQLHSHMLNRVWDGVQDLQNRMQGMEDLQGCVHGIEENLFNLTLDVNRQMAEVNLNVNLILHKLED